MDENGLGGIVRVLIYLGKDSQKIRKGELMAFSLDGGDIIDRTAIDYPQNVKNEEWFRNSVTLDELFSSRSYEVEYKGHVYNMVKDTAKIMAGNSVREIVYEKKDKSIKN